MIIELGDNGLRDWYHWRSFEISDAAIFAFVECKHPCSCGQLVISKHTPVCEYTIAAAYLAVRSCCKFLTSDNHDWTAMDYGPCKPEHQALKDLTQSSRYSIVINRKAGNERRELYPFRYWFHFCYRVPGQPY